MAPMDGQEIVLEVGEERGIKLVGITAVSLDRSRLQPALDEFVRAGNRRFVLDIAAVGDMNPDAYRYIADLRAGLVAEGGDLAVAGTQSDRDQISNLGYQGAIPAFDGPLYAVSYLEAGASR